jgi:DCN1-like protein 1/2
MLTRDTDSRNDEKDTIGVDGTMAYLTDLGVDLENASVLIPVEIIQAPTLGEITKQEFIDGWKKA